MRDRAKARGRRALPYLLRDAEPVFICRGYFAHDVKALFDPFDHVIFDGMDAAPGVTRVVLLDGPALDHAREIVQRSIPRALEAGNYEWKTTVTRLEPEPSDIKA